VEEGSAIRAVEEGICSVQDEASQLVGLLASRAVGPRTLDACAAPGGKTVMIAAAMPESGVLVAADVRDRRMRRLARTIAASGATNVHLVQADLLRPPPFRPAFDFVFVDAPCSGLGTLRRDPDIRWRRRESDLTSFAAAELTMLQHAAEAVAPGGRLMYGTCSSEPEENEGVSDAFLASTNRFAAVHARDVWPAIPHTVIDARGHLRTDPVQHGLEAFFAAIFQLQ
jgi:16S rRNA (cytosine967-C5)-methyltransferase